MYLPFKYFRQHTYPCIIHFAPNYKIANHKAPLIPYILVNNFRKTWTRASLYMELICSEYFHNDDSSRYVRITSYVCFKNISYILSQNIHFKHRALQTRKEHIIKHIFGNHYKLN